MNLHKLVNKLNDNMVLNSHGAHFSILLVNLCRFLDI